MPKKPAKYQINLNEAESEVLPNQLGISTRAELELAEFEGFLYAYEKLFDELNPKTKFDLKYLLKIHHTALGNLYGFAGKYRTVNISKGGFMFPPALFLDKAMKDFEAQFLLKFPDKIDDRSILIYHLARIHAELLFIHPFREGNGRTARLLANLMSVWAGFGLLDLEGFMKTKFEAYIVAVQQAANQNYQPMEVIFESLL